MIIADAELIFWYVAGVVGIIAMSILPLIGNYLKNKDTKRMFDR